MPSMLSKKNLRQIKKCHICGKTKFTTWAKTTYQHYMELRPDIPSDNDPILGTGLDKISISLKQCNNCTFIFTSPQFLPVALAKTYISNASYFDNYNDLTRKAANDRRKTFLVEIKMLEKLKPGGKILDVGCGGGFFLNELASSWHKTGVDIDPNATRYARTMLGKKAKIYCNEFKKIKFPKNTFDTIVIRGTVEHVPNPRSLLKEAIRVLKPGGILAIGAPNIDNLCANLYKRNYRVLDPIHHIWNFSPTTLGLLLNQVGFEVKEIVFNYFNTPYFNPVHLLIVAQDWFVLHLFGKNPQRVSPPFYGNIMDVYSQKPK